MLPTRLNSHVPTASPSFPSTRWSLVLRAADLREGREALDHLLRQYSEPVRRYLAARWGVQRATAEDLLQAFVTDKILEQDFLARATADRGTFRAFLLTALNRFASNQFRDERRLKRGGTAGGGTPHRLAEGAAEPASPDADPSHRFDLEWATLVIERAIDRMRRECEEVGRADVWGVFDARVLGPTLYQRPAEPYERLVDRFRFASPEQASNVLITGKRMFTRCLRGVVAEYAGDPAEVDAEIADLQRILARPQGRAAEARNPAAG